MGQYVPPAGPTAPSAERWVGGDEDWDQAPCCRQRFSIEAPVECLSRELRSYDEVARWMSDRVKLRNTENMVVCKKASLPRGSLRRVASGAFHACLLDEKGQVGAGWGGRVGGVGLGWVG